VSLFRARSIRTKLALLISASVGAAVFLSFGVGSYRELTRFGEAKRAELQATAQVLAATVADAVARGDRGTAVQALNGISRIPAVRFAEIRAGGDLFAEAGTGVALTSGGRAADGDASFWAMLTRGSLLVDADVIRGGRQVGTLSLLVDTSDLFHRLKQAIAAAALSAVAAIFIGMAIASRMQRSITRPLRALAGTMNEVRLTSDFSRRAQRHSDDETGQLVDSFNDMLDQIRGRDRALEDHRAGLEQTVELRTRELAVARDVAESANRAKSDFLATMSHEIRTPMNGMLVMAELLAGTELPARQQRYAETIVRSGQTLLTIINDILDLSKIEAGKLDLEQVRVPVATLVEDVLGLFWERASSKSLDLAASIAADVPAVIEADPVRVSQILSNLVNNALKFTETGHVQVSVRLRDRGADGRCELLFSVADTGIGIPADKVDHIFEAFSQVDQSTTRRFGGTGLGLSISQRLIGAMAGEIWAESEEGKGSVFHFTIRTTALDGASQSVPHRGGIAVVAVSGGATSGVIAEQVRLAGYSVRDASEAEALSGSDLIFADPAFIEAHRGELGPSGPQVVCVAGVGNSAVDRLLGAGLAQATLMQPVLSVRVVEILQAAASGTLASLGETRCTEPAQELPDMSGLSVLVADDSPVNREVVTEALNRFKVRTRTVEDGREAVEAFQTGQYDLVLMDCSMPVMDGFAATRAIRELEKAQGLPRRPVIALTAHLAGGAGDSWREAGMDDYLTKPFTMRSLAECLTRWRPEGLRVEGGAVEVPIPAEPAAAAEEGQPLDGTVLQSLRSIAGGNAAMLDRIFGLFLAHAPARLEALKQALAAQDLSAIAAEAHALKSPSLNIGALRLGALCSELEAEARTGSAAALAGNAVDRISAEMEAVTAAIEAERGRQKRPTPPQQQVALRA
jgi:two-component system sensor histidine kinase BarA